MPDPNSPVDLNVPSLSPAETEREESAAKVDLEGLAREIWALLKANLREENDRVGRV